MSKHTKFIPSLRLDRSEGYDSNTSSRIDSTQVGLRRSPAFAFCLSGRLSARKLILWVGLGIRSSFHV